MNKYVIPLFFVCVHNNVDYKVVAEFLCQNMDNEVIFTLSNTASGATLGPLSLPNLT